MGFVTSIWPPGELSRAASGRKAAQQRVRKGLSEPEPMHTCMEDGSEVIRMRRHGDRRGRKSRCRTRKTGPGLPEQIRAETPDVIRFLASHFWDKCCSVFSGSYLLPKGQGIFKKSIGDPDVPNGFPSRGNLGGNPEGIRPESTNSGQIPFHRNLALHAVRAKCCVLESKLHLDLI